MQNNKRPTQQIKLSNEGLEELLDEDSYQIFQKLPKSLGFRLSTVGKRLKVLGMINKDRNWLS